MTDEEHLTIDGLRDFANEVSEEGRDVYVPCEQLGGAYIKAWKPVFLETIDLLIDRIRDDGEAVPVFSYVTDEHGDIWLEPAKASPSDASA